MLCICAQKEQDSLSFPVQRIYMWMFTYIQNLMFLKLKYPTKLFTAWACIVEYKLCEEKQQQCFELYGRKVFEKVPEFNIGIILFTLPEANFKKQDCSMLKCSVVLKVTLEFGASIEIFLKFLSINSFFAISALYITMKYTKSMWVHFNSW